jgi:hypothetical protein
MRPVTSLALMQYGSTLFGSTIATSDQDYVGVHLPSGRAILLGDAEATLHEGSKAFVAPRDGGIGSSRIRATLPGEIDRESHALGKVFDMLRGGHMIALDMLFVPDASLFETSTTWNAVRDQRQRLISRNCRGFVGYAQSQAEMYGRKATRLGDVEATQQFLIDAIARYGADATLETLSEAIYDFADGRDHIGVAPFASGYTPDLPHLVIAGKKVAFTHTLPVALRVAERTVARYGKRAQAAQDGTDWKSVAHAVRVAHQAIELLKTGTITFPRPEAELLRQIRRGEHHRRDIGLEIDRLLEEVETASRSSVLPAEPDRALMDDLQVAAYRQQT